MRRHEKTLKCWTFGSVSPRSTRTKSAALIVEMPFPKSGLNSRYLRKSLKREKRFLEPFRLGRLHYEESTFSY